MFSAFRSNLLKPECAFVILIIEKTLYWVLIVLGIEKLKIDESKNHFAGVIPWVAIPFILFVQKRLLTCRAE